MITVTKKFGFEASHRLPQYVGDCSNLHGHSYKLDVTVTGEIITPKSPAEYTPQVGMIIDFKVLKSIVEEVVIKKYDHTYLNHFFENPTAEIMVKKFAEDISASLPTGIKLVSVKLWETDTSYAEWRDLVVIL